MAYESYCAACTYLKEEADSYGKYWCERKGEYHYACDPKCYSFCEAYRRSDSARGNMYDNSSSHTSSSGCYITTTMCDILGYPDDNHYLQTLRIFRNSVLKKNRNYWGLLIAYDIIGPTIANNLKNEAMKISFATFLLEQYICPAVFAIESKQYDKAINIYVDMTNALANKYGIDSKTILMDIDTNEISNPESLGHARKRILTQI